MGASTGSEGIKGASHGEITPPSRTGHNPDVRHRRPRSGFIVESPRLPQTRGSQRIAPPLSQRNCVPTSVSNQPRVSVRRRCDESMETARGNSEAVDWVPTRRERSPTKGNCERAAQASHPEKPTRQSTRGHRSPLRWNRNRLVRKATTDGMGREGERRARACLLASPEIQQPRPGCSTWNTKLPHREGVTLASSSSNRKNVHTVPRGTFRPNRPRFDRTRATRSRLGVRSRQSP